jgi:hypothetical protein
VNLENLAAECLRIHDSQAPCRWGIVEAVFRSVNRNPLLRHGGALTAITQATYISNIPGMGPNASLFLKEPT